VTTPVILHASAFAYEGAGCLVLGEAGSGKSSLLAHALLLGAELIADDQVMLRADGGQLIASAPETLTGIIELYGLGIVSYPYLASHPLHLVVALEKGEAERLPEPQQVQYCGLELPFVRVVSPSAAQFSALLLYLKAVQEHRTLPTDWRPER
jgi:HPr kinase/phosphorylase